ncbi:hypothetical protein EVAR_39284_1 [Eumeta japonica]|uniref:Uncharacterized protein n=1 Tax=Eumeta variegata TaxID=151549 RepID=A0A4C1VZG0_EUMVA|nr:hypothetical protein EVAR_39284_1 [Eumeta japonica]
MAKPSAPPGPSLAALAPAPLARAARRPILVLTSWRMRSQPSRVTSSMCWAIRQRVTKALYYSSQATTNRDACHILIIANHYPRETAQKFVTEPPTRTTLTAFFELFQKDSFACTLLRSTKLLYMGYNK